jgi:PKD domain-containing protein
MNGIVALILVVAVLLAPSRHASHTAVARECPKLVITCPKEVLEFGKTYVVQVRVDGADSTKKLSYKWSVSSGKIVDGQGTPTLKVRFTDAGESLTATVDVGGLPDGCETSASCSFVVS